MRTRQADPFPLGGLTDPQHVGRAWSIRGHGGKDPLPGEGLRASTFEGLVAATVHDVPFPVSRGWLITHAGHRAIPVPGDSYRALATLLLTVDTTRFASATEVAEAIARTWPTLASKPGGMHHG